MCVPVRAFAVSCMCLCSVCFLCEFEILVCVFDAWNTRIA